MGNLNASLGNSLCIFRNGRGGWVFFLEKENRSNGVLLVAMIEIYKIKS
jgi:hypothetical protein